MAITPKEFDMLEETSGEYTATLTDESGDAINGTVLSTLTLTLYNQDTALTIINSRNDQNVLNTNGVTIDVNGLLTWTIAPDDNEILNTTLTAERHTAQFNWTWGAGKIGRHEIVLVVKNLNVVP